MKKIFAIVIAIIIGIMFAISAAAENIDLVLAGDNARLVGVFNPNEFKTFTKVEAAHAAIPGGLGNTGCVLRVKAVVTASAEALTSVSIDDFNVVNYDLLAQVGYTDISTINAVNLISDTVVCDGDRQAHRMVGMSKVSSENLAAEIKIDGRLLYVLVYDWDGDVDKDTCLVAGNSSDMRYRRGSKASTGGSSGGSNGNTTNEATGGSNEPDPNFRDWPSSDNSSSSNAPDPHYRNF